MLGTSRHPPGDLRGQIGIAAVAPGTTVRQRYTPAPPAVPAEELPHRWWQRLLQIRHMVNAWLRRVRQRRALIKLDRRLPRNIDLSPDCLPPDEERRACSVPFRLPRQ